MRGIVGIAIAGLLSVAACEGTGNDGLDVRYEAIVFDYGPGGTDPGTRDPGARPDDGPNDPGAPVDPGTPDPGGFEDPGAGADPGVDQDPGMGDDPGGLEDPGSATDPGTPTDPGQDPGTDPGVDPGMDPGSDPGIDPGIDPGTDPGVDPGTDPGLDPGMDPGTDPGASSACSPAELAGSCQTYYACRSACTTSLCQSGCEDALSARGISEVLALENCLDGHGCYDLEGDAFYDCLDANCMDAYYGCFWGCTYDTCGSLVDCIVACDDSTCINGCWDEATTGAQIGLQDTLDCMDAACPVCSVADPTPTQEAECDTCWSDAADTTCAAYWEACTDYGTGDCRTLWSCYNYCEDSPCVQACVDATDKAGRDLFFAVFDCIDTYCADTLPSDEWATCATATLNDAEQCGGTYLACQADGA